MLGYGTHVDNRLVQAAQVNYVPVKTVAQLTAELNAANARIADLEAKLAAAGLA